MPVKRILAATLLLALASCDTYQDRDQYGPPQPYPAPMPYPPAPYPGQDPYQPAPFPGQDPSQPAPPECPISASRDWTAWINRMPGPNSRPMLVVSGKVVTSTGGFQVSFAR